MKTYVLIEGQPHRWLIENLLTENTDLTFIAEDGFSTLLSIAVTVLINHRGEARVLLLLDADSLDSEIMEQKKEVALSMLRRVSLSDDEFKIIFFQPSMEVVLFQDASILKELTGREPSDTQLRLGQYQPRQVLRELMGTESLSGQHIPQRVFEKLRQLPVFQEVESYLTNAAA
jgi:hypothetical protein